MGPMTDATVADYRDILMARYETDPCFVFPDTGFLARLLKGRSAFLERGQAMPFVVREGTRPRAFAVAAVATCLPRISQSPAAEESRAMTILAESLRESILAREFAVGQA